MTESLRGSHEFCTNTAFQRRGLSARGFWNPEDTKGQLAVPSLSLYTQNGPMWHREGPLGEVCEGPLASCPDCRLARSPGPGAHIAPGATRTAGRLTHRVCCPESRGKGLGAVWAQQQSTP